MPQVSNADQTTIAAAVNAYSQSLSDYQTQRALDPGYDSAAMNALIAKATGAGALLAAGMMAASFADAQQALRSLNNVISKAAAYVNNLQGQVSTWNRIATIGAAVGGLFGAITGGNPLSILSAADGVAQAISGKTNTSADPQAPNGLQ